jgi:hypothetical protein
MPSIQDSSVIQVDWVDDGVFSSSSRYASGCRHQLLQSTAFQPMDSHQACGQKTLSDQRGVQPERPTDTIELVGIEAAASKAVQGIRWRQLQNDREC